MNEARILLTITVVLALVAVVATIALGLAAPETATAAPRGHIGHTACLVDNRNGHPTGVRVSDIDATSATVTWTNPDLGYDSKDFQTRLVLLRASDGQNPAVEQRVYEEAGDGPDSYTFTSLTEETVYEIRVSIHWHSATLWLCSSPGSTGRFTASADSTVPEAHAPGPQSSDTPTSAVTLVVIALVVVGSLAALLSMLFIRRRRRSAR